MIRDAAPEDAGEICAIYNHYIRSSVITFEEDDVSESEMRRRVEETTAHYPWLVYESDGGILGYAYASRWKTRSAYRFSAETTVYLRHDCQGRGIGSSLYRALLDELKNSDIHSLIAVLCIPNPESESLHEKLGFKKVGELPAVGYKFGRWLDVGYWQLIL